MSRIAIDERNIDVDEERYLVAPDDWDETVATELARREDIALTDAHWSVLHFMRDFYAERQVAGMRKPRAGSTG